MNLRVAHRYAGRAGPKRIAAFYAIEAASAAARLTSVETTKVRARPLESGAACVAEPLVDGCPPSPRSPSIGYSLTRLRR